MRLYDENDNLTNSKPIAEEKAKQPSKDVKSKRIKRFFVLGAFVLGLSILGISFMKEEPQKKKSEIDKIWDEAKKSVTFKYTGTGLNLSPIEKEKLLKEEVAKIIRRNERRKDALVIEKPDYHNFPPNTLSIRSLDKKHLSNLSTTTHNGRRMRILGHIGYHYKYKLFRFYTVYSKYDGSLDSMEYMKTFSFEENGRAVSSDLNNRIFSTDGELLQQIGKYIDAEVSKGRIPIQDTLKVETGFFETSITLINNN